MKNIFEKIKNLIKKKWKVLLIIFSIILVVVLLSFGRTEMRVSGGITEIEMEAGLPYSLPEINSTYYHPLFPNGIKAFVIIYNPIIDKTLGEYTVRYTTFFKHKEVKVRVTDKTKPVISLMWDEDYFIELDEVYFEEGYVAIDNRDGDITDKVVISEIENGIITYTVSDSSGNTASVLRHIKYVDHEPPVITVYEYCYSILEGSEFRNPKFSAIDNIDGDITENVIVTTNADVNKTGVYSVNLFVKDRFGNETSKDINLYVYHIQTNYERENPSNKVIYLTFDDGPRDNTGRILDILDKYNVKATFFVTGSGNSNYIGEEYRRGHSIGIHSYSHNYSQIYVSEDAYYSDFYRMENLIYEQTGIHTKIFRFPGGASNTVSTNYCRGIMTSLSKSTRDRGYRYFDWNVSSGDAGSAHTGEVIYYNVICSCITKTKCVVLHHDFNSGTVDALPSIIEWGIANGYTFLPITDSTSVVQHGVNN